MEPHHNAEPTALALRDCLYRVGRVSEQVNDLEQLLQAIIEECATLLDCESASVAVYNDTDNDLSFAVASGEASQGIRRFRMAMGEGIVGRVATTQEPYFTNDTRNDPTWSGKIDQAVAFTTRNLAAVPMVRKGLLIGVLEAINCRTEGGFRTQDLEVMQLFADQVAIAIENQRLIAARQESERRAALTGAVADISHTIKNILQRLIFPARQIDKGFQQNDMTQFGGYWPIMLRAVEEIGELVQDMLNASKPPKPKPAPTDVARAVAEVAGQCRADAESKRIELKLEGCEGERVWTLDEKMLRHALHNLIGNAIDAIAEHGGSRVAVTLEPEAAGGALRLTIADDGPGIPPEIQKRIFEPFFSTKKAKGTGLGLANVKMSVEAHGGKVLLHSVPGQGTAFTLCYPPGARD